MATSLELSTEQVANFHDDGWEKSHSSLRAATALSRKDGDPGAGDEVRTTGTAPSIAALFNDFGLRQLLEECLEAPVPEVQQGQIALLFPGNAVNQSNPK